MEIFKLVGSVMVDTSAADKSLQKTDKAAESTGKSLLKSAGKAAKWGLGITAAAGAGLTAMVASSKATAANADVIDKASQRIGIDAESYQELAYQAELCGVDMSTMEKAAKKLEGTDMNFDEAMQSIWELGTAEERSAKAAELFGDAVAYNMSPMLNQSAEDMEAMRQEANDLGLVMSNDAVKAGADMNDTFTKIDGAINSVKNEIGQAFMPMVNEMLNWIIDHMPEIKQFVSEAMEFVKEAIAIISKTVKELEPVITTVFKGIVHVWNTVLKPMFSGIITFLNGVFTGNWKKIFQGLSDIVKGIFGGIVDIVKLPINAIIGILNGVIDGFNKIKIPDWVPEVGGMGINIPKIPMLAEGGDIQKSGTVLVGEAGPELLSLPAGARVTPLDKTTQIDYNEIQKRFENALKAVAPFLATNVTVEPKAKGIFDLVVEQSYINAMAGKQGIYV